MSSSGWYGYRSVSTEVDDSIEHQYKDCQPNKPTLRAKVKKTYFKTKQSIIEKIGKRQDQFVVDGDADVDARLESAHCVRSTCRRLSLICSYYQKKLGELSDREQELADFLRAQATHDHTRAGSAMGVVGDGLEKEADSRMRCDGPLSRLQDELETFQSRAVEDMTSTTKQMEKLRRNYRAGLLWLKDASKQLDPEDHKQLTKYREAQQSVKESKKEFERLKLDVSEKIELLGASYCSLLSQTLQPYYMAIRQVAADNQQNFKELLQWSRSHQQHQYRLLKEVLQEQQEKLREAAVSEHGATDDLQSIDQSSDLTDLLSWTGSTSANIPEDTAERAGSLTMGEVLKDVAPEASHASEGEEDAQDLDDDTEWQEFQAARSPSLEVLLDAPGAILETQQQGDKQDEQEDAECVASGDTFDPLLSHVLEREPSPPPTLEPEDEHDDLDDELKKITESLAALQPASHGQTDSDLLATLSQGDVILPSALLDFDPTELSSLDFTPCLEPGVKEEEAETGHKEIADLEKESSKEKVKAQRVARAKAKESLSSWLNVFSHLDPLDNPDLLEGNASDKEGDEKQSC